MIHCLIQVLILSAWKFFIHETNYNLLSYSILMLFRNFFLSLETLIVNNNKISKIQFSEKGIKIIFVSSFKFISCKYFHFFVRQAVKSIRSFGSI